MTQRSAVVDVGEIRSSPFSLQLLHLATTVIAPTNNEVLSFQPRNNLLHKIQHLRSSPFILPTMLCIPIGFTEIKRNNVSR